MYKITRTSKTPNSPLTIIVDRPQEGSPDFGMSGGGQFQFMPNGQDGDTFQVDAHVAKTLMLDPGNAVHFSCEPSLDGAAAAADDAEAAAPKSRKRTGKAADTATTDGE